MHQFWHIQELVDRVVKFQAPYYDSPPWLRYSMEGMRDVCALARTCRAIQEPTLDIVWYRQSTFVHVLRRLPPDLWYENEVEDWKAPRLPHSDRSRNTAAPTRFYLTGSRPICPEDWHRVDFYARRVRKLWVLKDLAHPQAQEAETRNVYDMLRASKSASLFPNLNFVQMQLVPSIMTLRLLHVVASPSLQEIDISLRNRSRYGSNEGSDPGVPKLMEELSAFCESCPSVKTLHLTASTKVVDLRALSKTLQACRDLRSVVLMVHDPRRHPACPSDTTVDGVRQLLSQLSSLPWLHELNLTPGQFDHHQDGQTVGLSVPLAFQDLVIVNLRGVNDSFLKSLLRDCLFPSLGSLRVDVTHAIFPTFAGLLKASVSTETFHTLEVDLPRTVAPFPVFGWPELRPLLSFHNLESLSMSGRAVSLEVSDQYWEVFARSWPRLRRLHIGDSLRDDGSIGVNPSFTSLVHLVRNCPKLSSVTLTLRDNSDHIIDFAELDALPVSEHLTELHLRHTSFRHLGPPAAWIARMFPRLAMLTKAEQFSDESMVGIFGNFSTAQWDELFDAVRAAAAATSANEPFPAGAKLC